MSETERSWEDHARTELGPKMASSAFVITLNPDEIDPKIALETGYALLLNKPIVLVVSPGREVNEGLRRAAIAVVELREPFTTDAGAQQLMAELAALGIGKPR